jgi:hypothetical protein
MSSPARENAGRAGAAVEARCSSQTKGRAVPVTAVVKRKNNHAGQSSEGRIDGRISPIH